MMRTKNKVLDLDSVFSAFCVIPTRQPVGRFHKLEKNGDWLLYMTYQVLYIITQIALTVSYQSFADGCILTDMGANSDNFFDVGEMWECRKRGALEIAGGV